MTENNIDVLRELTRRLVDMDITHPGAGFVKYDIGEGTCIGLNIRNDGDKSIQEIFLTAGSVFPWHSHDTHETLKAIDTRFEVSIENNDTFILEPGQSHYFPPGSEHTVKALEDGWILGITVPADKAYPVG